MSRRTRGEGVVSYSASKGCWIYRARVGAKPNGRVIYREGRAKTKTEAVQKLKLAERSDGETGPTVAVYLNRWIQDVAKPNTRPQTWERYATCLRLHVTPRIGGYKLKNLKPQHVSQLYAELHRAGVSPGNIRKVAEVLASAMEHAVREGSIPTAPTRATVKPRSVPPPIEVFTDTEVKAILDAAKPHRLYPLIVVLFGTGIRLGEALALEWGDVAEDRSAVHVRRTLSIVRNQFRVGPPKSRLGTRTVTLPEFVRAVLPTRGESAVLVFPNADGTGYIARQNFHRTWVSILETAGIPFRKPHTARHSHASRLLADGVDPAEVARRLGDRVDTVMRAYAHWMPGSGRDTASRLDRIYGAKGL